MPPLCQTFRAICLASVFAVALVPSTFAVQPKRLTIVGQGVLDDNLVPIRLRGVNMDNPTPDSVGDLKTNLQMNFVRFRILFEPPNIDLGQPGNLTAAYRSNLNVWISNLTSQGIWVDLEGHTDDAHANDPNFYQTGTTNFAQYLEFWRYLASTFKSTDYIAAYGILAEPSAQRGGNYEPLVTNEPVNTLTTFQRTIMDMISANTNSGGAHDTLTPFIVGTAFNYDTLQFRYNGYFTNLAAYSNRMIYAVNFLTPKPWITSGMDSSSNVLAYGQPALTNFDVLIDDDPNTTADDLQPPELRFNDRIDLPANQSAALNAKFIKWYLGHAVDFADKFKVPLLVDQFGATTAVTNGGQLLYEQDVIAYAEANGLHWSRWSYNLGSNDRDIIHNPPVRAFYQSNLAALVQSDHVPLLERLTSGNLRLTWAGRLLQSATNLTNWTDLPGLTSPLKTNVNAQPWGFWRLRIP
ncbi:MAG: cellulase family glycosylhydrolase [Verrucomicrobia bacterium]|nr:cellulase family glycosylhydrolase [Verrucomicrobiota bacterium]